MKNLIVLIACMMFTGCITATFVGSVDTYCKVILPEYVSYVKKDTTLSDSTKKIRTKSAEDFQTLVTKAKEKAK